MGCLLFPVPGRKWEMLRAMGYACACVPAHSLHRTRIVVLRLGEIQKDRRNCHSLASMCRPCASCKGRELILNRAAKARN